MTTGDASTALSAVSVEEGGEDLPAYCANPLCRQEFRRKAGPGRRQEYHSELCRRTAEREYRRALQRLAHFENQAEQQRVFAAAFGRAVSAGDGEEDGLVTPDVRRAAEDAVVRVGGMLAFLRASEDPLAIELCAFHDAVEPVVRR
jgi:hypothetical protein